MAKEDNRELEEKEITEEAANLRKTEEDRGIYYVEFTKPINFEGKTYDGVDLKAIQNLTTKDKIEIDRAYEQAEGIKTQNPIFTTLYTVYVAVHITKLPIEFFYRMSNAEYIKIENKIRRGFFMPI